MEQFWNRIRRLMAGLPEAGAERRLRSSAESKGMDWLPPVLGPSDWSLGMMADRSAGWYFERR